MAKKKRKQAKKATPRKAKRSRSKRSKSLPFDIRQLEGMMQGLFAEMMEPADTPLDSAQELIYEALESDDDAERLELAHQALELSPDCADAYVILAEQADTLDEALRLHAEGVAAGERSLGEDYFKEFAGDFWGMLETRPYMRARLGLAQCLWAAGRREEALGHYREMLRLNPNDNQGIRYLLLEALMDADRREDAQRLLDEYKEDSSANWGYTRAILAFREEGDTEKSRQALKQAAKANPHVPEYLVGNRPVPRDLPEYVGYGDEDEAVSYIAGNMSAWRNTPGAITWLRKVLKVTLPDPPPQKRPTWAKLKQKLAQLEQIEGEVWQVDARQLALPADRAAAGPGWGVFVTNRTDDQILVFDVEENRPSASVVWDYLLEAMFEARERPSHRPVEVQVRQKTYQKAWQSKLGQVGIECSLLDQLDQIDQLIERSATQLGRQQEWSDEETEELQMPSDWAELPQAVGETWQADVRRLATWIEGDGELIRPWSMLVFDRDNELVLAQDLILEEPSDHWFRQRVLRAMIHPLVGDPHRPSAIEVHSEKQRQALEPLLTPAEVNCVVRRQLEGLDDVYKELSKHFDGPNSMTALVDVPGMDHDHAQCFYEAAAEFYRRSPWRMIPGDMPIQIRCDKFQSGPWYAVVMGQSGLTLGVALYEDREVLGALLSGSVSEEESFRKTSALSVTFNEAFELPIADLEAVERNEWEIAGPEAYPCAIRVNPGQSLRPPLVWEVELLEATLRAVPEFLTRKQPRLTLTVPVAAGDMTVELSMEEEMAK